LEILMKGKIVLVTGANGGLGRNVTQAMLDAGATVVGTSRKIEPAEFNGDAFTALPGELSSPPGAQAVVDFVLSKFGRLALDSPWLKEANERVVRAARDAGIAVGVATPPTAEAQRLAVEEGFDFVATGGENHRRPGADGNKRVWLSEIERRARSRT